MSTNLFTKPFTKLLQIGTAAIEDSHLKRYILLVNKMSLYILLFDSAGAAILYAFGLDFAALIFGIAAAAYGVLLPLLNYLHRHNTSRFLFFLMGVLSIFFLSLYLGETSYAHLGLFVAASTIFCMFSPNEYHLWLPAASLPLLAYATLYALDFTWQFQLAADLVGQHASTLHAVMWTFTFFFIALICFVFTSQSYSYEAKLTNLIRSLAEENAIRQKAETRLARAKDQNDILVSILVHDMSNSFTSIQHAALTIGKSLASPNLASSKALAGEHALMLKSLHSIEANLDNVSGLIRHVRKMSLMVNDTMQLALRAVCVETVVTKVMAIFESILRAKNISLNLQATTNLSETYILADEITVINEVLANVLSNAIKFSFENGRIDIKIAQQGEQVHITIRDYGVGIAADKLPALFDVKSKRSQPGTKGEKGHGLGLSLVKSHMSLLKGEVAVTSQTLADSASEHGTTILLSFCKADGDPSVLGYRYDDDSDAA